MRRTCHPDATHHEGCPCHEQGWSDDRNRWRERFKAGADVYELQFYPHTPVGFYRVWGTTLAEVLTQAEACFPAAS